jgi:hypothetical protein
MVNYNLKRPKKTFKKRPKNEDKDWNLKVHLRKIE